MEHILDNPMWTAMISGNKELCSGNDEVKYFIPDVSPFVGLKENSAEGLVLLNDIFHGDIPAVFVTPNEIEIPKQWKLVRYL